VREERKLTDLRGRLLRKGGEEREKREGER
jgi:hypothetical protein